MNIGEWLHAITDGMTDTQGKLVTTALLFFIIWLVKRIALRSLSQVPIDQVAKYNWRKNITYIIYGLAVLSLIFIWSDRFASFATFLGLLSAGLAIAFKDPIANVAGWYYIISNRPFRVGDRIQIGEDKGDVVDVSIFRTTVVEVGHWVGADQSTGRVIHFPNYMIFTKPLKNFTELLDHIWNEIRLPLTMDSNWEAAKDILEDIIREAVPPVTDDVGKRIEEISEKYLIVSAKLTPIVYTSLENDGTIVLTLRYLCLVRQRRQTQHAITEKILRRITQRKDIFMAHQTVRIIGNEK